jgi:hypothetical protein
MKEFTEAAEICAVVYFFGEDVGNVAFSHNVSDGDSAVGNPLVGHVFSIF